MPVTRTLAALALGLALALPAVAHDGMAGMDMPTNAKDYGSPGGGDPNPSPGCSGVANVIQISGTSFSPSSITIQAGEPVCWTWSTSVSHNVTADDGSFSSGAPSTGGTFQVTFKNAGTFGFYCQVHGSTTGGMRGQVIVNDDSTGGGGGTPSGPGTIQLSATGYTVTENAGPVVVTVQRTGGHDGIATVKLATSPGTAKPGKDFLPKTAVLRWNDGEDDDKTVEIGIKNDSVPEPDETFSVHLSKATGATLGTSAATVTIHDDDTPGCPSATAAPADLAASGLSSGEISVRWADGSASGRVLHVERAGTDGAFRDVATLAASAAGFVDRGLPAGTTFLYRVRVEGAAGESVRTPVVAAATDGALGACAADALCLGDGRFEVKTGWRTASGTPLSAGAPRSLGTAARSGLVALDERSEPQVLVSIADRCAANDHFAIDLSAVTDAELLVQVRDTLTGRTWAWYTPGGGGAAAVRDLDALASCP